MLTMDRVHVTFASRRPRSCMRRKPRLGSHLFLELDKTNRRLHTHTYHGHNGSKAKSIDLKKGASLQENRETSHESSERFNTCGKPINQKQRHFVHTKDLNQLVRDGHTDKKRIPENRGNTTSRFLDDDISENASIRQEDNGIASRGHYSARNVWKKYDVEHLSSANFGPDMHAASHSKPVSKCVENKKVGKKIPTFNVHGITHYSEESSQSLLKMEKKKCSHVTLSPSTESPCIPEVRRRRRQSHAQGTSGNEGTLKNGQNSPESERNTHGNHGMGTPGTLHLNGREGMQVPTVRKSSRVPKKRIFDDDEEETMRRPRKRLEVEHGDLNAEHDEAMDLAGDESDCLEKEYYKKNEISGPYVDEKKELPLTARQRSLRLSKEGGDLQNENNLDFPDGLQPVLPRKHKESLNEAEKAIKKEEAARRRKLQMERNAAEIQASAIQKILGQESSRKKREEKLQKQRQEIEQEKQAASMVPAVNSIRWVMGPSGNVVSFSQDVELPKIFSGPCSYPQEREKCAGPSCNNAYKYRDAKTRLPLCSLHCYRAVQELPRAVF